MTKRIKTSKTESRRHGRTAGANVGELIRTGYALQTQGRVEEAIRCFEQVLRAEPANPDAIHLTSLALMNRNRFPEALRFLRKWATHSKSRNVATQYYIGYGYYVLKRYKLALEHLDMALALDPRKAITRLLIAKVHIGSGRPQAALEFLQQGPAIASPIPEDMISYADVLTQLEQYRESRSVLMTLLESGSYTAERLYDLILLPPEHWSQDICEQVDEHLRKPDLSAKQRSLLSFSAGRIADQQERYRDAFRYFGDARKLSAKAFDLESYRRTLDVSLGKAEEAVRRMPARPATGRQVVPVFVTGMPRSGKTVLEKLLALRPEFAACGEIAPRMFIDADIFINSKGHVPEGFEERITSLKSTRCATYARDYIQGISEQFSLPPETRFIINTLPHNYLNIRALKRIFPACKFVFVSREKNDLFVFSYMKNFKNQYSFTRDFRAFTQYYDLVEAHVSTMRQQLPADLISITYEDIVSAPADALSRVYRFLGADVPPADIAALDLASVELTGEHIGYWKHYRELLADSRTGEDDGGTSDLRAAPDRI